MCQVDLFTGRVSHSAVDFQITGPSPVSMVRHYRSTHPWHGDLGYGWGHPFGLSMRVEGGVLEFRGRDGRRIPFPIPAPDQPSLQPSEKALLSFVPTEAMPWAALAGELPRGAFALSLGEQPTLLFDRRATQGLLPWRGVLDRAGR